MTGPLLVDGKPVYPTYDQAQAAQDRQLRNYGIYSGIIRCGDQWQLRYDITGG